MLILHSQFSGIHRNNTESAFYSNPKNVLRQTLNKHWFPSTTTAMYWTNNIWAKVQKWSYCFPCVSECGVWLHRRPFLLCLVCGTGLVNCSAGLSPFVKDRSSKHRNVLGCWYFLAITEAISKLWLKKGSIFFLWMTKKKIPATLNSVQFYSWLSVRITY